MKNYYKKKLKSSSSVFEGGLLFVLIFGFITLFALINLIMPDREYSENENKYLAKSPKFTWATLVSGKFALDYETYVCEQFLLRDNWISAKSLSEFALLKVENNGVVYGKQGYMFPKFFSFDAERLNGNLAAIDAFAYECPAEVSVMIVPSAFYPLSEYVPRGLPHVDEGFYIDRINEYLSESAKPLDIEGALSVHANEYIYYRTDHHWTTYGAYLAYSQFAKQHELVPFDYKSQTPTRVDGFLGTSYTKSKAFNAKEDVLEYFGNFSGTVTREGKTYEGLYDLEQFKKRDKYSGLLYGNTSFVQIESEFSPNKLESILIIRDSYADSLVPFLTEHYNRIVLIDPRYYNADISALSKKNFTDVLVLFGFEDLCTVKEISRLKPSVLNGELPSE